MCICVCVWGVLADGGGGRWGVGGGVVPFVPVAAM